MSSETTYKIISILALIIALAIGVYTYRELSYSRSKLGSVKYLNNQFINMESRMKDIETRQEESGNIVFSDTSSEEEDEESDYDIYVSSEDEDENESQPVINSRNSVLSNEETPTIEEIN